MSDASHAERYWKRFAVMRSGATGYMNNQKWFKLFRAMEENGMCCRAELKLLAGEHIHTFTTTPGLHESGKGTRDGAYGPVLFKEIEWLYIPGKYEVERFNRDEKLQSGYVENTIVEIQQILDAVGKFEYDLDEDGIKIYGYK